ncbi:MAG: CIA30 family protein [Halieaceae bacterium]|nr:CIA30 family protein [Halieaceae bacterium]
MVDTTMAGNLLPNAESWIAVNDGVMGGVSRSTYRAQQGYAGEFSGEVSLENNGGFASVRAPLQLGKNHVGEQLRLAVLGDGKTYSLRLRTHKSLDGIAYAATIDTVDGEVSKHRLTPADFQPVWRGRRVSGAPSLRWQDVRQIGLMISNKQQGPFVLRLISLDWTTDND